ncbi:MAG TPA: tetratricopeptide repeat protein [Blastocatellia bacterium]|jgi:tetratricopeptide (TPR) repeat protein|nr:tetratricopeptide repeat protein [Blastocatellia bacterium]
MERRATQENPVDLIDSGQFLTAEEIFSERRTDDPLEMVVRSEVAIYFDRLADGAELLQQVASRIGDIDVAARFSLARGRLALWEEDDLKANTQFQTAYHFYLFQNDNFGLSQALLGLANLARRHGNYDDAKAMLATTQEGVKGRSSRKMEFLRGLIAAEQAALAADRGEVDHAAECFSEAARMLKSSERGRFYARSLVGAADLKCSLGDFQDSLELYKEANTIFERYDVKRDRAESQLRLAEALIRLNRYERAEKLAEESRELVSGNDKGESRALALLALLALQQNELDEAASRAILAVELGDRSLSASIRSCARISLGQVRLAERDFKQATEILKEAVEIARVSTNLSDNRRLELAAVIYLAEAYHSIDTRAGRFELVRASEILSTFEDAWLGDEFNRVSAKYEEQIVFTDDNRLVFDGNQLPRWQEAKRTLEGFLLRNALRQTNNSLTRAARKLGVSKVHVHNLKKKHGL